MLAVGSGVADEVIVKVDVAVGGIGVCVLVGFVTVGVSVIVGGNSVGVGVNRSIVISVPAITQAGAKISKVNSTRERLNVSVIVQIGKESLWKRGSGGGWRHQQDVPCVQSCTKRQTVTCKQIDLAGMVQNPQFEKGIAGFQAIPQPTLRVITRPQCNGGSRRDCRRGGYCRSKRGWRRR